MIKIKKQPTVVQALFFKGLDYAQKQRENKPLSWIERIILWLARTLLFKTIQKKFGGQLKYIINGASAINIKIIHFMHNIGIPVMKAMGPQKQRQPPP